MKSNNILNYIILKIETENTINIGVLEKVIESNILDLKDIKTLFSKLKKDIKKYNVIIESASKENDYNKKRILESLGNPIIYEWKYNHNLIGGLRIKKDWEIIDTSIERQLNKIGDL
jgi:F0F1-type ATP synthase delta subunit